MGLSLLHFYCTKAEKLHENGKAVDTAGVSVSMSRIEQVLILLNFFRFIRWYY